MTAPVSSSPIIDVPVPLVPPARPTPPGASPGTEEWVPADAPYGLSAFLDGLNPLHHVPVVGMIYRAVTGEHIEAPVRIAGSVLTSALYGGPLGVLGTVVLSFAEEIFRAGPAPGSPQWGDVEAAHAHASDDPASRAFAAYAATMGSG